MDLTVALQPASAEEHGAVVALLQRAGLPTSDIGPEAMDGFLIARDGEQVIGTVGIESYGADGLLRSLAVDPAWRRHGIADALVRAAEEFASRRGHRTLWLLTTGADEYFIRHRYAKVERASAPVELQQCPQFRSLCPATATLLSKPLD